MSEFEAKGHNDEFGSAFDDLDIDAISLFQADFMSDVDLDFLLTGCETQPNNDAKAGNFSRKNSTLASLLKPHPSCGYVPPAPQIHVENNSVIESGTFKRLQVNFPEFETHPQLKNALIQEKTLPTSSGGAGADNVNILHCGEDHIEQTFHDISSVASNQRNTQNYQHVLTKTQADGSHFPRQNYDMKSLRRSPHNAIERRYRQSINGKINELREMLNASSGDDTKTNKSAVLRRAIDRIRYLEKENECLRMQLSMYENGYAVVNDINEEGQFGFKAGKGRLVRIKADPAAMPHHVEVLRPIQKPQQSLMSRSQPPQQLISSWGSQGSHLPPISSSDEGSPPSMIGVSSIISSTSDDVSTVSSPEPYQFIHANRKRNADTHLFQQICSSDANMGNFYVPGDRLANDDTIRLPLQSFTPASDGFKGPSPTYNSADVAFTDVNSTTINGFNGYQAQVSPGNSSGSNFTRLSLFWGSFSLLMFNPFVISSSGAQNREGAHSAGMPILRLFSAISLSFRHSEGSDDTMSALSPLFLSFMYAAQWIVAILLLLFACPRNFGSVLPSFLTRGWGKRIRGVISELPGGRVSLLHWKRCQEHTKKRAWIEAGSRLKEALTVLDAFPSIGNGLVSTFCAHISAYFEGLRFAAYRLPQFFWHLSSKRPILRAPELLQVDAPTVSQLRRQLLDLKFLDLIHLSDNNHVPQECPIAPEMSSRECLHFVHLMFACLDDFVVGWCSAHTNTAVDLAELTRLGLVLALSIKRFFGVNWLGNLLLRATQRAAENLNDGFVCLGSEDGPIMTMLLSLSSNDFSRKHKVKGTETYHYSFLRSWAPDLKFSLSKSLVVDAVHRNICEIFTTKALECIVSANLEPPSPFKAYMKEIKRLTLLLYGEKSSFLRSQAIGEGFETSFSLIVIVVTCRSFHCEYVHRPVNNDSKMELVCQDLVQVERCFNFLIGLLNPLDGERDLRAVWEEKRKKIDAINPWRLSILRLAGKWYAGSLDFEDIEPNGHITPCLSSRHGDAQLISLAYNLLHMTQSKAFSLAEINFEGVEAMLFEVWTAIRGASDLLEQMESREWDNLSFISDNGFKHAIDRKNYIRSVYQLVSQDWILHSLNSIANKLRQENNPGDNLKSRTNGCHQPSTSFNTIIGLFSDILDRQRRLVRCLQASPSLWITKVEMMYRHLNRANPVWTSLIWNQRLQLIHRRKALSDKTFEMDAKGPVDDWKMSTQKNRLIHTKEQPIFTCQAHVFTINPSTRRSWVQASSRAIDINIFFDSTKQCYRIVSVEDGPTGMKVVINSTITPKMVFKQTSQKFGQWADPKSSGVFGLGFDSEADLNKFVAQFRQCVENTKQTNGEPLGQGTGKQSELQPSPLKNGLPVLPEALAVSERSTLPLAVPPNSTLLNTLHSGVASFSIAPAGMGTAAVESTSVGGDGQQLMHQQYYQDRIQRLERELESVRRQASRHVDSASPGSPLKNSDGTDLRDGLELVNLASSDSGSGTGGVEATVGSRGTSSLVHKAPVLLGGVGGSGSGSDAVEQLVGSETSTQSDSITAMLKLHSRLGRILQDACDLHKQIGHLLSTVANQPVH